MLGQFAEIISHWLHLLGAAAWIGGLSFYLVILSPTLKNISPGEGRKFMELAGIRFRAIGLLILAVLLITGLFLSQRILQTVDGRAEFFSSAYGRILGLKILVSLLVIIVSSWIALVPVPKFVLALESQDEIRARSLGRLILYISGFILVLSSLIVLFVALLRLSA